MEAGVKKTALHGIHVDLGAKMAPFAGFSMPIQYAGIRQEHEAVRRAAGLFDVSHMGQLRLTGPEAAAALESLLPIDVLGLPAGRQRYGFFTNASGGILDDLMLSRLGTGLLLVVNAARKSEDIAHLKAHLTGDCAIETLDDRALLALQGPAAVDVLGGLAPQTSAMAFMDAIEVSLLGADCYVSRSGYTGV
jgi:aminomethyltransferase